jgi:YebC/PmpR family DNA-binding regulatory protein
MSGHSKWATIKRKKGDLDAKKGKIFTKLVREITTAARMGGGDPGANPRLRVAIVAAKAARMPADNIERGIKKGTGDLDGPPVEEINYEGYGPGGVAIFVQAQTDNRNRSSADIRSAFGKGGGNLGASGSVAWMFNARGHIVLPLADRDAEGAMDIGIDAGADDVQITDEGYLLDCDFKAFNQVLEYLEQAKITMTSAELTMVPANAIQVAGADAEAVLRLIDRLDDLDDVQKVYANCDIDADEMARINELPG